MITLKELTNKLQAPGWKWTKWSLIVLTAAAALRVYYVREMIAALIIFSVLFAAVYVVILVLFLLDRASERLVAWCEAGASHLASWIADGIEGIIARPVWAHAVLHRLRKEQLKQGNKI